MYPSSFDLSVVTSWIEYINRVRGVISLSLIGAIPKRANFICSSQCLFYAYFKTQRTTLDLSRHIYAPTGSWVAYG